MKRMVLLVLLVACGDGPTTPAAPVVQVAGEWAFTGTMSYGADLTCADTMTWQFAQDGTSVRGTSTDWHFVCGQDPATGVPLDARGRTTPDSIGLRWVTNASVVVDCPGCWTFDMFAQVSDSIMSGRYIDFLGGAGLWVARVLK